MDVADVGCMEKQYSVVALVGIVVVDHFDTFENIDLSDQLVPHTFDSDHDQKVKLQKPVSSTEEYDK